LCTGAVPERGALGLCLHALRRGGPQGRPAQCRPPRQPRPTPAPPAPPPGAWLSPRPSRLCAQCVGDQFAFAEATVILARVLQAPSPSLLPPRSPRPEAPPAGALCAAALCAALTWSGGRSATTCRLQCPRRRWAWRRARPSTPRRGCPCGWRGAAPRRRRLISLLFDAPGVARGACAAGVAGAARVAGGPSNAPRGEPWASLFWA